MNKQIEAPITEYLHQKASIARIPLNGSFEITPVCNMACKMCYVRMTKNEQEAIRPLKSASEWVELGRIARDKGMLYLLITGGEPFLHPEIKEILFGLNKLGLLISINSNGTMIDESVIAWLKDIPPMRINVTLYGASDKTYGKLCGNPHGFTQVMHGIDLLQDAGITVKINCSLTTHNSQDLEEIYRICEKKKLIIQSNSYMFPPLRRDSTMIGKNDRFSPEEAAWNTAKIEYLSNGKDAFINHYENDKISAMGIDLEEDCHDDHQAYSMENNDENCLGDGIKCRAGKCSFWVTWEGVLMACGMLPSNEGVNVFEAGFDNAWEKANKFADSIRLPYKCKKCNNKEHCQVCAAMTYTETGNFSGLPLYRCQMAENYPVAVKYIYNALINEQEVDEKLKMSYLERR